MQKKVEKIKKIRRHTKEKEESERTGGSDRRTQCILPEQDGVPEIWQPMRDIPSLEKKASHDFFDQGVAGEVENDDNDSNDGKKQ